MAELSLNSISLQEEEKKRSLDIKDVDAFSRLLVDIWGQRKINPKAKEIIGRALWPFFDQPNNPFTLFLDLYQKIPAENTESADTLHVCIWHRFTAWQQSQLPKGRHKKKDDVSFDQDWAELFAKFLSRELIEKAAHLALQDKAKHFLLACNSFRFSDHAHEEVFDLFSKQVLLLAEERHYRGISEILETMIHKIAPCCSLFNDEMLRRQVLFFVCKNKSRTAKRMLSKVRPFERVFTVISFVDSFVGLALNDRFSAIRLELGIQRNFHIPADTFESNAMELCKNMRVPRRYYRNIVFLELRKKIGFIIRSTFGPDAEMDLATFRELVHDFAKIDTRSSEYIVKGLIKGGHLDEARYLADFFDMTELFYSPVFSSLSPVKEQQRSPDPKQTKSKVNASLPLYELTLSDEAILFIDNVDKYRETLNYMLTTQNCIVGIDSEWPGVVPPGQKQLASILQLGLTDRVFILDLLNLAKQLTGEDWKLLSDLFASTDVKKITFGFRSDVSMLKSSYPEDFWKMDLVNVVDLETMIAELWRSLRSANCGPISLQNSNIAIDATLTETPPRSLVDVACRFLGRRISKMFRMSNWNRRPLLRSQLLYAAIDAYCLLEIYREMCYVIESQNLDMTRFITATTTVTADTSSSSEVELSNLSDQSFESA